MVCQNHLLNSIQAVHKAVIMYSNCIIEDEGNNEHEVFQQFGLELSTQLATLRLMYLEKFGIDPVTGRPQEISYPCDCTTQKK